MHTEERIQIGQRLSAGFQGLTVPPEYAELVKRYKVGNAILFRRNVESFGQLKKLCAELRELALGETGHAPFIMLDEECGRVSRLAHIAAPTPCAMAIGATGDPENARRIGRLIGEELRAVGVNFNLAPVMDCLTNQEAAHGNRCFAIEPEKVAEFGTAYLRGLQDTGVIACAKHFPGHGDTAVDSHLGLPVVEKPMEAIWNTELVSFRDAIQAGVRAVMTAHVVFPVLEPERVPATVSRKVITGLLRQEMGFGGIIVSDSMEMNAVKDLFGISDGTRRALAAGVDIALICHSPGDTADACEALYNALEQGTLDAAETLERYRHIARCKQGLLPATGDPDSFGSEGQKRQAREIMRAAVRTVYEPEGQELPRVDGRSVFLGVNARLETQVLDDVPVDAVPACADAFGGRTIGMEDPVPEGCTTAVVFLNRHPEQERALRAANRLADAGVQVIAVCMNTPIWLRGLSDRVWQVEAWQYDRLAVDAVIDFLRRAGRE